MRAEKYADHLVQRVPAVDGEIGEIFRTDQPLERISGVIQVQHHHAAIPYLTGQPVVFAAVEGIRRVGQGEQLWQILPAL